MWFSVFGFVIHDVLVAVGCWVLVGLRCDLLYCCLFVYVSWVSLLIVLIVVILFVLILFVGLIWYLTGVSVCGFVICFVSL